MAASCYGTTSQQSDKDRSETSSPKEKPESMKPETGLLVHCSYPECKSHLWRDLQTADECQETKLFFSFVVVVHNLVQFLIKSFMTYCTIWITSVSFLMFSETVFVEAWSFLWELFFYFGFLCVSVYMWLIVQIGSKETFVCVEDEIESDQICSGF